MEKKYFSINPKLNSTVNLDQQDCSIFLVVNLKFNVTASFSFTIEDIYIFIVIALDETSILVAVQFSIYESCDLGGTLWRSNIDVHQ